MRSGGSKSSSACACSPGRPGASCRPTPDEQLIARLRPALGDIRGALDQISTLRDQPAGRVRLLVPRLAAATVLAPKLGQFARQYPDVVLDVTTDDNRADLVAAGFDAGIDFGEFIQQNMIAVRVSRISGRSSWVRPTISRRIRSRNRRMT